MKKKTTTRRRKPAAAEPSTMQQLKAVHNYTGSTIGIRIQVPGKLRNDDRVFEFPLSIGQNLFEAMQASASRYAMEKAGQASELVNKGAQLAKDCTWEGMLREDQLSKVYLSPARAEASLEGKPRFALAASDMNEPSCRSQSQYLAQDPNPGSQPCKDSNTCQEEDKFSDEWSYISALHTNIHLLHSTLELTAAKLQEAERDRDRMRLAFNRANQGLNEADRKCRSQVGEVRADLSHAALKNEELQKVVHELEESNRALRGVITRHKNKAKRRRVRK